MNPNGNSSSGKISGAAGALFALVFFFMPWILVSCGGQQLQLSGMDLANGVVNGVDGEPILYIPLISAILSVLIAWRGYSNGSISRSDGYGWIGLGILSLIIIFVKFSELSSNASQNGLNIELQLGFYGVVVGNILIIIGGFLSNSQNST